MLTPPTPLYKIILANLFPMGKSDMLSHIILIFNDFISLGYIPFRCEITGVFSFFLNLFMSSTLLIER